MKTQCPISPQKNIGGLKFVGSALGKVCTRIFEVRKQSFWCIRQSLSHRPFMHPSPGTPIVTIWNPSRSFTNAVSGSFLGSPQHQLGRQKNQPQRITRGENNYHRSQHHQESTRVERPCSSNARATPSPANLLLDLAEGKLKRSRGV